MKFKAFLYYWLPVLLYASVIFYLSSLSQIPSSGITISNIDKLQHAIEYFVLSALLLRAFLYTAVRRPYVYSIVLSALYGVSDEIHQLFVAGRVFSGYDMIADALGACLVLFFLLYKKKN